MAPVISEVLALLAHGFSQAAVARFYGVAQSTLNQWLRTAGATQPRRRANVNRLRRDGLVSVDMSETWEPYRILHPAVASLVSDRHFRPASALRIGIGRR